MTDRLDQVREALSDFRPGIVQTPDGSVDLRSIEVTDSYVDVTVGGPAGGDPHFRIHNPPTSPDPLSAIAHAVALNGGARP